MRFYNEEEIAIVKKYYPIVGAQHTVAALRDAGYERSSTSVQARAWKLGLKSGINNKHNAGRFQKGATPPNKGQKVDEETYAKIKHTFFQPGQEPHNTKHDGAISIRRDTSTGKPYKYIRLAKGKWEQYHRWLWKKEHGPIPRNYVIAFIDGDSMNCDINNLKAITRRENIMRNQNREKFRKTCERLTDKQIAGRLSFNDPELRAELLEHPEVIEAARKRIYLNREIKKAKS